MDKLHTRRFAGLKKARIIDGLNQISCFPAFLINFFLVSFFPGFLIKALDFNTMINDL